MAEVVPDLATTTEESESDSGNSEVNWGWVDVPRDCMSYVMESRVGVTVPVTVGNSSLSDS